MTEKEFEEGKKKLVRMTEEEIDRTFERLTTPHNPHKREDIIAGYKYGNSKIIINGSRRSEENIRGVERYLESRFPGTTWHCWWGDRDDKASAT